MWIFTQKNIHPLYYMARFALGITNKPFIGELIKHIYIIMVVYRDSY
jgi:hypothetical protein